MRIYIGNTMYEVDEKVVKAAKKITMKCLETVKGLCEASEGEEYLYVTTLVTMNMVTENVLSNITDEKLEEMFQKVEDT